VSAGLVADGAAEEETVTGSDSPAELTVPAEASPPDGLDVARLLGAPFPEPEPDVVDAQPALSTTTTASVAIILRPGMVHSMAGTGEQRKPPCRATLCR
jgi:hypothetical protein